MTTTLIGQSISRVDGRLKVTGGATYAAEFDVPGLAYGAIVRTTVIREHRIRQRRWRRR